jgi:hypothetical protein
MRFIQITLENDTKSYSPGTPISGTVRWELEASAKSIEVRLFFYTAGKGTSDVQIVESIPIETPSLSGSHEFQWQLPQSPYSFSGKLISLIWSVEVVLLPSGDAESCEFQMSPTGKEILLSHA